MRAGLCLLALGFTALALGCASVDLSDGSVEGFRNGVTTVAQVTQRLGYPRKELPDIVMNGRQVQTRVYTYASPLEKPAREGDTAVRVRRFYFHGGVLVGHDYVSTFASDGGNFDLSRVKELVRGRTTRAEALELVGKPSGYLIYPVIRQTSGETAVYSYTEASGPRRELRLIRKKVYVYFNAAGLVAEVAVGAQEETVLGL